MGNKQAKREFQIYEDEQKEQEDTEDGRRQREKLQMTNGPMLRIRKCKRPSQGVRSCRTG